MFFFYTLKLISPNLNTTICAVVKYLDNMKITDYDGGNVSTVANYLRTVNEYLTQNKAVLNDFDTMVFDVMKTATTKEFRDEVKMLAFARKREGNKKSAELILDKLQTLFIILWPPRNGLCSILKPKRVQLLQSITPRVRVGTVTRRDSQCTDPKDKSSIQKACTDFFNSRNKKGSEGGKGDCRDNDTLDRGWQTARRGIWVKDLLLVRHFPKVDRTSYNRTCQQQGEIF